MLFVCPCRCCFCSVCLVSVVAVGLSRGRVVGAVWQRKELGSSPHVSGATGPGATGRLRYQDDQCLFEDVCVSGPGLPLLSAVLFHDGHRLRMDTCSIRAPALDCPDVAGYHRAVRAKQAVASFKGVVKVCRQGIDMLGSAARGELAMSVRAEALVSTPSRRLEQLKTGFAGSVHPKVSPVPRSACRWHGCCWARRRALRCRTTQRVPGTSVD